MVATGHAQRISPPAMARPYVVHYTPSCTCAFEWRFYAPWRYCRYLAHGWPNWRASRCERSVVVRMTNLCDGIGKSSAAVCYTDLRVHFVCAWQLSDPLVTPVDHVFFPSFLPKPHSSFPKSQRRVITRFCSTSSTAEATQHFPRNTAHHILAHHQRPKFLQGFPPTASFNNSISSDPARENF